LLIQRTYDHDHDGPYIKVLLVLLCDQEY
jgi:hypothetical protein